jgi:hypothetical protein
MKDQPSMKDLFERRDATEPGSAEEDQAVDRIMGAVFPGVITTVTEAKALIAKVDAAEASGMEMNEENMLKLGFVKTEGNVWELPIPVDILHQLDSRERLVVAYEKVVNAPKESPEQDKAWGELVDILFENAK